MKITNHDLHIMITKIDGKLNTIIESQKNAKDWQLQHSNDDKAEFNKLHERVSSLRTYGTSIAIVAAVFGSVGTWAWNKITGQS